MTRRSYTSDEKAEALCLYAEHGPAEASKRTGIPGDTISSWARRTGVQTRAPENLRAAVEANVLTVTQRKAALASGLLDDAERLRGQLFAPAVERKAMVVGAGNGISEIEVAEVEHPEPTFGDKKAIMTAIAIAVDKVQLLTGEATSRVEGVSPDERRRRLAERLAELDARPSLRVVGEGERG